MIRPLLALTLAACFAAPAPAAEVWPSLGPWLPGIWREAARADREAGRALPVFAGPAGRAWPSGACRATAAGTNGVEPATAACEPATAACEPATGYEPATAATSGGGPVGPATAVFEPAIPVFDGRGIGTGAGWPGTRLPTPRLGGPCPGPVRPAPRLGGPCPGPVRSDTPGYIGLLGMSGGRN